MKTAAQSPRTHFANDSRMLKSSGSFSSRQMPTGLKNEWRESQIAKPWRSLNCLQSNNSNRRAAVTAVTLEPDLPPPVYYQRHKTSHRDHKRRGHPVDLSPVQVVVSLLRPHMIVHISDKLCERLDYKPNQVSSRSIRVLHGPQTNQAMLETSIKKTASMEKSTLGVKLYSSDGVAHETNAIFSPVAVNGVPVACLIEVQFKPESKRSVFPCPSEMYYPKKVFESHLRQFYRAQYNQYTGIENCHASKSGIHLGTEIK